jgi:hypothetical protein
MTEASIDVRPAFGDEVAVGVDPVVGLDVVVVAAPEQAAATNSDTDITSHRACVRR